MGKLGVKAIEAAKPRPESELFLWDGTLPGFGVRVKPSGTKSFLIQYRTGRRTRRLTLGRYPVLKPEEARKHARLLLAQAEHGRDPSAEKRAAAKALTMADLCDRYLSDHAEAKKAPRSIALDRSLITRFLRPVLGRHKVADVTRADVLKLHHDLRSTPRQANMVLALLRKMMNLAEGWGLRPDGSNPCRHVERFKEGKRERFLSADELGRLGAVLAQAERDATEKPAVIVAVRLLILTGCRLSEILTLRWEHVDLQARCLRLPTSKTGPKVVHLAAPALSVLASIERRDSGPFVIAGGKPDHHLVDLERPWRRVRARADLQDMRLHDLRHSFASVAVGLGEGLPMISKLLGHTQAQTTHRYAHLAVNPIKAAAERIGTAIAGALDGRQAEVVNLPRGGSAR